MENNLPFPLYKHFLTQTTFENIVTKGDITHGEEFLCLPQCFQLYSMNKLSFMVVYYIFAQMFSKLSAADLLYVEKGKLRFVSLDLETRIH